MTCDMKKEFIKMEGNEWETQINLLIGQLVEFRKVQYALYQYYKNQITLDDILKFIKSAQITEPANKHKFIDFFNLMINCDLNDQLFKALQDDIFKIFTKNEIFSIFAQRKKILHKLLNLGFISPHTIQLNVNDHIFKDFYKDLKSKLPESYLSKYICKNELDNYFQSYKENEESKKQVLSQKKLKDIMKEDDLDGFLDFANRTNLQLNEKMPTSSFESDFKFKKNPPTFIEYAAKCGSVKIFKYLLANKVEISSSIKEDAVYGGNVEIIHIVEDLSINFDSRCLSVAIETRNNVIYDYLRDSLGLKLGLDQMKTSIRSFNLYSLIDVIKERSDLIQNQKSFIEIFSTCCSSGFYLLFDFLYINIVPLFNSPRFDINFKYFNDETILHIASKNYKIEMLKVLLQNKDVDVNAENINGILCEYIFNETPLYQAVLFGRYEIVNLLLKHPNIRKNQENEIFFI